MSVGAGEIDQLCEFAIDFLLSKQGDAKALVVTLVKDAPTRSPLEVVFVLSSAAASIEAVLAGSEPRSMSLDAWRMAALLGVDLHMMQLLGRSTAGCQDLMQYWQTEDPYFLS